MKKVTLILAMLALALVSAAPAFAQDPNLSQGDAPCSEFVGQEKEYCLGALEEFAAESGPEQLGVPEAVAPSSEAGASASASANASAPAAVEYQYGATGQYQEEIPLPETGGFNLPLFLGVALILGGIIVGTKLYLGRR